MPRPAHRRGPFARFLGRTTLRAFGWSVQTEAVVVDKAIFVAAPHTSNWDGFFMLATSFAMGVKLSWVGKQSLFKPPFGFLIKALGGVAIDRSGGLDTVGQIARVFAEREHLLLAIAPSGTRKYTDYWKTGFYHVARAASVPIMCGFVDYEKKTAGIGPVITTTGDIRADMAQLRAFYDGVTAKVPADKSPVRLRDEV
jgi:1-acyl-sn-glycerol-3-phosphate acyltransferase